MKVKILLIGAVVLLALTAAYAADVTGKWVAETQGRNGPTQVTFTLKADGAKLTGTVLQGAQGEPTEITEGKVDGDNISFVVVRNMGGNEMKMTWKGTVSGDEIKFTREFQAPPGGGMGGPGGGGGGGGMGGGRGGPQEIVAKRVK
jgi:hypothetical protein